MWYRIIIQLGLKIVATIPNEKHYGVEKRNLSRTTMIRGWAVSRQSVQCNTKTCVTPSFHTRCNKSIDPECYSEEFQCYFVLMMITYYYFYHKIFYRIGTILKENRYGGKL